jgi:hypothetical protein
MRVKSPHGVSVNFEGKVGVSGGEPTAITSSFNAIDLDLARLPTQASSFKSQAGSAIQLIPHKNNK